MKDKVIKVVMVFLMLGVALNLTSSSMNEAVIHPDIEKNTWSCFPSKIYNPPNVMSSVVIENKTSSPLVYLFQIMFILFFISPPIIAFMLFLIWKELKERNKMK